jgi:outer membrane protein TolC
MPALTVNRQTEQDVDHWTAIALESNPQLRSLRSQVLAAENRVRAAKAEGMPTLRGELEAAAYNRKSLTRDEFSAALILDVPILTGGETDARVARQQARLRERRAELLREEREIRQAVLELWLDIQQLQVRRRELEILGESRELDLDLRRTEYEIELTSDLGDSMTRISDYRLQVVENQINLSLAWARLDALTGRLLSDDHPQ